MENKKAPSGAISRRTFLKSTGTIVFALGSGCYMAESHSHEAADTTIPASDGYLVVDVRKCQGCISCMLACSLVHEGVENPSLSRIQILQNPFGMFPSDLNVTQCRQCVRPACVDACPEGALTADPAFGHVRRVNPVACTGCGECMAACPYMPKRVAVAADESFSNGLKARKCDLCAAASHHWDEAGGGPDGMQACVEVCPVGAIAFTRQTPVQEGDEGYRVNLRSVHWNSLGYRW